MEAPVGRCWPPHRYEVGAEKIREYASAVGEQADHFHRREAAARLGFDNVVAPPVFAAVLCAPAVGAAIFDPAVGIFDPEAGIASYRFVHRSQLFTWHRPVVAGDVITTVVELAEAHEEGGRLVRVFESRSTAAAGDAILTARYEGVVPPAERRSSRPPTRPAFVPGTGSLRPGVPRPGEAFPDLTVIPDRYAPVRYAGASGDFTPFHLDAELARAMGLEGPILHGLYTFAQAARAHTVPFGSDPRALRQLSGRFRRPAYPERELLVRTAVESVRDDGTIATRGEITQGDSSVLGEIEGLVQPSDRTEASDERARAVAPHVTGRVLE